MIEQDLLNAFNDSIDRLAAGQTLDDCLRAYPHYANQLRPMLNAGQLAYSAAPDAAEIAAAQARVRQRILSMTQPPKARPRPILWQVASLAASLALVFLVTLTGSAALAQNSLPGDILYGMKILTEDVRLALSGESTALQGEFNDRRIDEIRQLAAARRPAETAFTGTITTASGDTWEIAGLPVTVTPETIGANGARVGEMVKVTVATNDQGQIIAESIEVETHNEPPPEPTLPPTAVPTRVPVTQTSIPTLTLTPSNTPTMTTTSTETATPTATPSPTITQTPTNTPTMTVTFTPSPTLTPTPSPTLCVPQLPRGWFLYTIQPGDALSKLADRHGVFLSQIMEVNCLVDPGFIVVGERIYLPGVAPTATRQPQQDQPPDNNDNGSGGGGGGGGQDDNSNDNHDDHSDDNGNSNSNDNH